MKTRGTSPVVGTTKYTEEQPPLSSAFALAARAKNQPADKEEDTYFEGAD